MRLAVLLLSALALPLHAETVFNYDGFFARLKKSEQAQYSDITLAFLLQQHGSTQPCQLDRAAITTDISNEPLTIANNGELILPYSKLLNDRKALIRLYQSAGAVPCDLNFRLRSKMPLDAEVSFSQLLKMHQQFDQLLQELAGLGRYFLPEMRGLTLHFSAEAKVLQLPAALQSRLQCKEKQCQLDLVNMDDKLTDSIRFQAAPEYLVPWLTR